MITILLLLRKTNFSFFSLFDSQKRGPRDARFLLDCSAFFSLFFASFFPFLRLSAR